MRRVFYLLFLMLAVGAVDYSAIAVYNDTRVYIHAQVGDKWVLYIPPGGKSGSVAVEKGDSVFCRAIVAPGEDGAGTLVCDTTIAVTEGDPLPFSCEDVTGGYEWHVTR